MTEFVFTSHARDMLLERNIAEEWVWRTLSQPDNRHVNADDHTIHYLLAIPEQESRVLRVVVNETVNRAHHHHVLRPPGEEVEMRLKIDKENDVLYLRIDETAVVDSEEVQPGIILDFDKNGRVVGIEILALSTRTDPDKLRILQLETA